MPPIQKIELGDNILKVTDKLGIERSLNTLLIPSSNPQIAEDWLNNIYLPTLTNGEYQLVAHVYSTNPLKVNIASANIEFKISDTWWKGLNGNSVS